MEFIVGFCVGCFIFEPIVINLIYFSNVDLFMDLILTKFNKKKLFMRVKELEYEER